MHYGVFCDDCIRAVQRTGNTALHKRGPGKIVHARLPMFSGACFPITTPRIVGQGCVIDCVSTVLCGLLGELHTSAVAATNQN